MTSDISQLPPPQSYRKSKLITEEIQLIQYDYPFRYDILSLFINLAKAFKSQFVAKSLPGYKKRLARKLKNRCYFIPLTQPFYTPDTNLVYTSTIIVDKYIIGCGASFESVEIAEEIAAYNAINFSDWFCRSPQPNPNEKNFGNSILFDRIRYLVQRHLKQLEDNRGENRTFGKCVVPDSVLHSDDKEIPIKPSEFRSQRHVISREIAPKVRNAIKMLHEADTNSLMPWLTSVSTQSKNIPKSTSDLKNLKMSLIKKWVL